MKIHEKNSCGLCATAIFTMCFVALGCSGKDESIQARLVGQGRILISCIETYRRDKGFMPSSLTEAIDYSSDNIRGDIEWSKWKYILDDGGYLVIRQADTSDSVVVSIGKAIRVVNVK